MFLTRIILAGLGLTVATSATQNVIANGETRTLSIYHTHTKESATITFRRNGQYDSQALEQLNWLLRDWRVDEKITMDPHLFDVVWEAYREVGASEPIHVVSAYRSPGTNSMLRRRSRAVAKHSQHTQGKAMDFYLPNVSTEKIRTVAMRLQRGGVGYYPNAHNPFVHLDAGSVRSWPRMGYDQLARLFPNGKTVHLPRTGKPLPGYEEARAEIMSRGGSVMGYAALSDEEGTFTKSSGKSLWANLFGNSDDEDADEIDASSRSKGKSRTTRPASRNQALAYADTSPPASNSEDGGTRGLLALNMPVTINEPFTNRRMSRPAAKPEPVKPEPVQLAALNTASKPLLLPKEEEAPIQLTMPLPQARPQTLMAEKEEVIQPPVPPVRVAALVPEPSLVWQAGAASLPATSSPQDPKKYEFVTLASLPPSRPVMASSVTATLPVHSDIQDPEETASISMPAPPSRPQAFASLEKTDITHIVDAYPLPPARPVFKLKPALQKQDVKAEEESIKSLFAATKAANMSVPVTKVQNHDIDMSAALLLPSDVEKAETPESTLHFSGTTSVHSAGTNR